ncbi:hypothetical protein RB195_000699 [Necator americanus]|uniref:Uncharacterized protein n=1 Tax=Necator americanus TaxID=51031 RepID=A0ABR1DDY4_NECAM
MLCAGSIAAVRHHPRRVFLAPRVREECLSHRRTTQRSRLVVNTTLKIKTHTHLMMSIRKDNIHQMLSTYNNLLLNETIGG